ncbi:hypothetical protein [Mycolicibacterium goodii]|uniref:hypothetical protein n=1 Tax=Mycolicibacterium goodii TaxID=134601 RepID=UPI001C20EE01|nr:hypothetical protein [Mycolicibacterium goodii]
MAAPRKRPSPAARGYDYTHRIRAERLRQNHVDGTPCFWCGLPMYRDRTKNPDYDPTATRSDGKPDTTSGQLAADHPEGKGKGKIANRLLHGLCNKQRGDGSRDEERPALRRVNGAESPLGHLAMGWPAA